MERSEFAKASAKEHPALPTRSSGPEPRQGKARYVAIKPKPSEPVESIDRITASTRRPPKVMLTHSAPRCSVPICRRPNCKLRTHQQYAILARARSRQSSASISISRAVSPVLTPDPSGLPELPLKGLGGNVQLYRALLHDFFSVTYPRLRALQFPPPSTEVQKIKASAYQQDMLRRALQTPVYCLNYVAASFVARPAPAQEKEAVLLYGTVMKLLREKLADFEVDEVDNLMVVILTLVMLDLVIHNYTNLEVHRAGMILLINSKGGFHNLGSSLPYAMVLDRLIAVHTQQPPLYLPRFQKSLMRPVRYPHSYGVFFDSQTAKSMALPQDVLDFGRSVCRAIELFEGQSICLDVTNSGAQDEDVHYFYFLRSSLQDEFAHLNAKHSHRTDHVYCILLATKIVEYIVLQKNYTTSLTRYLARTLEACLGKQQIDAEWQGLEAALRWVQWAVACVPVPDKDSERMIMKRLVDRTLKLYEKVPFPLDWRDQGLHLKCVRNFAWARSLDQRLEQICKTEDALLRQRLAAVNDETESEDDHD